MADKEIATEEQEACALISWAAYHPICREYLIHIPNEGKRTPHFGRRLVLMGLKRGVSDFLLAYPNLPGSSRKFYHGLWIELKRVSGGRLSSDQLSWLEKMEKVGYATAVARGFYEAKAIIEDYLNEDGKAP